MYKSVIHVFVVTCLEYCPYGVKLKITINQSLYLSYCIKTSFQLIECVSSEGQVNEYYYGRVKMC